MINHEKIIKLISKAAELVLIYYHQKIEIKYKVDTSPVSEADIKSHHLIETNLRKLMPNIPVISEECQDHSCVDIDHLNDFWLIDPIDGTEGFLNGNDNFTINIAYMVNKKPKYGFIIIPTKNELYYNDDSYAYLIDGNGDKKIINVRDVPPEGCHVLMSSWVSQSAIDLVSEYNPKTIQKIGSAIKFCYIASGKADLYLREGTTMEWDTAAGDAILTKAGGSITDLEGNELKYCKPHFKNSSFIAKGNLAFPSLRSK